MPRRDWRSFEVASIGKPPCDMTRCSWIRRSTHPDKRRAVPALHHRYSGTPEIIPNSTAALAEHRRKKEPTACVRGSSYLFCCRFRLGGGCLRLIVSRDWLGDHSHANCLGADLDAHDAA